VAAINAGVLHFTVYSIAFSTFFANNSHRQELLAKIRHNKQRQELLRRMELLVIDEISMVRCDVMDAIDCILKTTCGATITCLSVECRYCVLAISTNFLLLHKTMMEDIERIL